MLLTIFIISLLIFVVAYKIYGKILTKKYEISDKNLTPSHTMQDNIDYVPSKAIVLFGHHFSSIAGAGPIVGPILAALSFGWLPALLWIIIGSIFIGGVHDFSSVVASIRNKGRSIAEIAKQYLGNFPYKMFLLFIWLSLVYVLIVFLDLTANTFVKSGATATSSIIYIFLAILFGLSIYRARLNFIFSTIVFVLLVFLALVIGNIYPLKFSPFIFNSPVKTASLILLIYIFLASILPVWFLLQPRDYLASFLLYSSVIVGAIGIIFGGFKIYYPAFTKFNVDGNTLFPLLFVTIACGAISGFHSLVASGTTSKQLDKESDAVKIGYGGMLMEGIVAVISLSTLMMLSKNSKISNEAQIIYGKGIANFASLLKIKPEIGMNFGILVLSTFLLTTLDTATRLGRYIWQEIFNWDIKRTRIQTTIITIMLPAIFAFITLKDQNGNPIPAWKVIWPIFGASNQLLAALTLLVISLWVAKLKKNNLFLLIPAIFMIIVTLTALAILILKYKFTVVGIIGIILFILAIYLMVLTFRKIRTEN